MGQGDRKFADKQPSSFWKAMDSIPMNGTIVIGESVMGADALYR
jgi:fructose-1,6-bisphosphatase/sedoheptulose 1,7-bisphosphatase-like protein